MGGGKYQTGYPTANLDWLCPSLNSATPTEILGQAGSSPGPSTWRGMYKIMGQTY